VPERSVCSLLALFLAVGAGSANGQRSDTLPTVVATAFRAAYPNATILHVSREPQDGKIVYEIESRDGSTRRDLLYDPAGQVIEIEEMIPADSVPAAVRAALVRDVPGSALVGAERVTRGAVVLFEVHAKKNGRSQYLTYDPQGVRKE
jgi:Putative beta-lactamase-inhibitor-like, PepSY-like